MVILKTPLFIALAVHASVEPVRDDDIFNFDDIMNEEFQTEYNSVSIEDSAKRDFNEFDVNKDGQLDPLEIRTRFKGYLNERDLFYFFDSSDKDHSGTVSWHEYLQYIKGTSERSK